MCLVNVRDAAGRKKEAQKSVSDVYGKSVYLVSHLRTSLHYHIPYIYPPAL
jgi:hypothetical protein